MTSAPAAPARVVRANAPAHLRRTYAIVDDRAVVALGLRALLLAQEWVDAVTVLPPRAAAQLGEGCSFTRCIVAQHLVGRAGEDLRRASATGAEVIVSCDGRPPAAASLRAAGASGYVCLGWPSRQLVEAIAGGGRQPPAVPGPVRRLSPRERQLIEVLASGATIPDAALALGISPHTARHHARNAYRKLDARNRVQAVRRAASVLGDPLRP